MDAVSHKLKDEIERNKPRAYDLSHPAEHKHLFRECRGYLHTCHHKHGTDWEGRKFAMDALDQLSAAHAEGRADS